MSPEGLQRAVDLFRRTGSLIVTPTAENTPPELLQTLTQKLVLPASQRRGDNPWVDHDKFNQGQLCEFVAVQDTFTGQGHTWFGPVKRKLGALPPRDDPGWHPPLRKLQEDTVIEQKPPDFKHIEFMAYEAKPGDIIDLTELHNKLRGDDDAKYYESHNGKAYKRPEMGCGWDTIKVLEFLNGKPFDNLAMAYIAALRPSNVRVSRGTVCLDCHVWRVTVHLKKVTQPCIFKTGRAVAKSTSLAAVTSIRQERTVEVIDYIEQEVEVGYGSAYDVREFKRYRELGKPLPDKREACPVFGNVKGLEKVDFS